MTIEFVRKSLQIIKTVKKRGSKSRTYIIKTKNIELLDKKILKFEFDNLK